MTGTVDLSLNARGRVDSYIDFLTELKAQYPLSITHAEAANPDSSYTQSKILIRHDVDHDLEKAVIMARIEAELGIKSSFYLLPPGDYGKKDNYYGSIEINSISHTDRLIEASLEIQSLGHEIGIHNDFVQLSVLTGKPLEALFRDEIAYFEAHGIKIRGSASHGSRFARACGFVNYEIFLDRNASGQAPREIKLNGAGSYTLPALAMKNIGLSYEAYSLRWQARLSDVGGALTLSKTAEAAEPVNFANGHFEPSASFPAGTCIVLIHPEHWTIFDAERGTVQNAPSDRASRRNIPKEKLFPRKAAQEPNFARPDGKPFRIAVRGDCVCRRAVSLNPQIFENGYDMVVNEKATNRQFLNSFASTSGTLDRAREYVDVDSMSGSLRRYFEFQFQRDVMSMEDVDLVIMDTYSDMNFQMWRHKTEGWSMWMHPKFTDLEKLNSDFYNDGFVSFGDAVEDIVNIISSIRKNNPEVPILFMYQPIEYYRKLEGRRDFYKLPETIASRLPNVYPATPLVMDELGPADMDSCGPGQTLHFDGDTYLKMITSAWNRGLSGHFTANDTSAPLPPCDSDLPSDLTKFVPEKTDYAAISYRAHSQNCLSTCEASCDSAKKSFAQYIFHPEQEELSKQPKRFTPMVIDFGGCFDFDQFEAEVKKFGKGARLRQKRKAVRGGYYCKPFAWKLHIPDVYDINHSKDNRSGGAMRGSYLRTVEEMGGAPEREYNVVFPRCNLHWALTFGAFLPDEDHTQGSVRVGERLVAYISLRRIGDIVLYSQILCHGDHLDNGALTLLHHEVVRWLDEHRESYATDLQYIMYGGAQNGGQSLYQWKRQAGFKARQLIGFSSITALDKWYLEI